MIDLIKRINHALKASCSIDEAWAVLDDCKTEIWKLRDELAKTPEPLKGIPIDEGYIPAKYRRSKK